MTQRKSKIILVLDALLLVGSIVGLGLGCGYEIRWLIIAGILGIALSVLVGVIIVDYMRHDNPMRRDPVDEITTVVVIS